MCYILTKFNQLLRRKIILVVNLPANMNSKKKTFIAITVKLLFSVSVLQAQTSRDSVKHIAFQLLPAYNSFALLKQSPLQNNLPGNCYAKQLPFFCSKELQVEKKVGVPIKFRLSTVEYCDKLEGKR